MQILRAMQNIVIKRMFLSNLKPHLPPAERGDRYARQPGVLDVAMPRGLDKSVQEVDCSKVTTGDLEHFLCESPDAAFFQSDVRDQQRDEAWDDIHRHPDAADIRDPIGDVKHECVVEFVWLILHILDVATAHVLLSERLDRQLLGSDVALFVETPEKTMRRCRSDFEHNLRWQIVLMSYLR